MLASINPDKFGWTIRFYDELFLLLNATVQQYYVRRFGGSLSEVFYGLSRVSWAAIATQSQQTALSPRARALAFVSLVLLPYVRSKLDGLVARYKDELYEYSATPADNTLFTRDVKRRLVQSYTTAVSIYEGLQVVQYVAYMANRSDSHSVWLRLLRMNLVYLPSDQGVEDWSWADLLSGKIR